MQIWKLYQEFGKIKPLKVKTVENATFLLSLKGKNVPLNWNK